MIRNRTRLRAVPVLCAFALWTGCRDPAPSRPSLLILLTVDTLRADRLGAYGSALGLTPHLDALADQSVVFEATYAPASFTVPSLSSIMTGRYPEELGIWNNESGLPAAASTLASELKARGWRTLAVVSNFVLREASGLAAGFERYDDEFRQYERVRKWPERVASDTTDAALAMLDGCATGAGGGCFLWVHYQDPHGPYTPDDSRRARFLEAERRTEGGAQRLPAQPNERGIGGIPAYQFLDGSSEVAFYRAGYDAEVNATDEQIGRLLAGVRERGLSDETAVVFVADHGESLGESDYWFAHGEHLTDVLVRVPLLVRIPGRAPERRRDVVSLVDLFGSLVHLATGEPARAVHRGRDLFAQDASNQASTPYMATLGGSSVPRYGLVDGAFKWIASVEDGQLVGGLYRRGRDDVDVAPRNPAVARRMHERLKALRDGLDRSIEASRPDLSDADRENLRALGYVDEP